MRRPVLIPVNKMVPSHLKWELGTAVAMQPRKQHLHSLLVPLADAPITTQSVHQETTVSSRKDRKLHEQLFILLSGGI